MFLKIERYEPGYWAFSREMWPRTYGDGWVCGVCLHPLKLDHRDICGACGGMSHRACQTTITTERTSFIFSRCKACVEVD